MELKYVVDDEGDLAAPWEEFRTYFMFRGEEEQQVFSVRTFYDRPHAIDEQAAAARGDRRLEPPHAVAEGLHATPTTTASPVRLIGEAQMLIGTGVSLEHFVSSTVSWVRASIEFDKWLLERLGLEPAEKKTRRRGAERLIRSACERQPGRGDGHHDRRLRPGFRRSVRRTKASSGTVHSPGVTALDWKPTRPSAAWPPHWCRQNWMNPERSRSCAKPRHRVSLAAPRPRRSRWSAVARFPRDTVRNSSTGGSSTTCGPLGVAGEAFATFLDQEGDSVLPLLEQAADDLWRCEHPATEAVLEAAGRHLRARDKALAKRLRRSATKVGSRRRR